MSNDLLWLACLVAVVFAPGVAATAILAILRWRKGCMIEPQNIISADAASGRYVGSKRIGIEKKGSEPG